MAAAPVAGSPGLVVAAPARDGRSPSSKSSPDTLAKVRGEVMQRQYRQALKFLAPCLQAEVGSRPDLEECLYLGEHAAKGLQEWIWWHSEHQPDDAVAAALRAVGIKPAHGEDAEFYDHDFFRRLARLFPGSRHAEEFEYVLIELPPTHAAWKTRESKLLAYLDHFPNGYFRVHAQLDLACIYDNVWDLTRPENDYSNSYRKVFKSGNAERDAANAEMYRTRALRYYQLAIKEAPTHSISAYDEIDARAGLEHDTAEARQRVVDLPAGKSSRVECLGRD